MEKLNVSQQKFSLPGVEFLIYNEHHFLSEFLPQPLQAKLNLYETVHTHATYEIFFAFNTPLQVISLDRVQTFQDQVVIIPPRYSHYTIGGEDVRGFLFNAEQKQAQNAFTFITDAEKTQRIVTLPPTERLKMLVHLWKETVLSDTTTNAYKLPHLYSLLFLELADIATTQAVTPSAPTDTHNEYAVKINAMICYEFMKNLRLKEVSDTLHLSEKQTARIIIKHFKQPLSALLLERRLIIASLYLSQTDIKIADVIELTGFQTENYFFSAFKKKYGVTPRAYRLQHQTPQP